MCVTGHSARLNGSRSSGREPGFSTGRADPQRRPWPPCRAPSGRRSSRAACRTRRAACATRSAASTASTLNCVDALARRAVPRRRSPRAARDGRSRAPSACRAAARRVVAQWTWLSAASLRSARCGLPCSRKWLSSAQVGYSGEHSRRDTANAPQAFAQVAAVASGSPFSQPRRKPRHEGVARAEHVVDLDREAPADDAVLEAGDFFFVNHAAHRPALQHDRRLRHARGSPSAPRAGCPRRRRSCTSSSVPTIRSQSARIVLFFEKPGLTSHSARSPRHGRSGPRGSAGSRCRTRPCGRAACAMRIALRCAASLFGREKCVPVTTTAPAEAMNASSMSSSASAMSAQSVR